MRLIQWHSSRVFTLLPVNTVNSVGTLKARASSWPLVLVLTRAVQRSRAMVVRWSRPNYDTPCYLSLSLSLSLFHTHTHTHNTHARAHTHTHTLSLTHTHMHTHTRAHTHSLSLRVLLKQNKLCCKLKDFVEYVARIVYKNIELNWSLTTP
jgi:hypothetical protein